MSERSLNDVGREVSHSRWITEKARAQCLDCSWSKDGSQARVVGATSRHIKSTGHRVFSERLQSRISEAAQ